MLSTRTVCRDCLAKGFGSIQKAPPRSRNFSSKTPRTLPSQGAQSRLGQALSSRSLLSSHGLRYTPSRIQAFGSQIRFNSSLNNGAQHAENAGASITQSALDFVSDPADRVAQDLVDHTRTPGYLRDMGLDFGWGFSTSMQSVLETIHSMNITEWGGSIFLTTVLVRICVFPLLRKSSDTSAKMQKIRPESQVLMDQMKAAAAKQDQGTIQSVRKKIKALYKANDIKLWSMALPFVQIPFGFGLWRVCRNMVDAGVPGLETGGYLWFQDLTVSDPYFILPMACALFQHLSMRLGGETGVQDPKTVQLRKTLMYGLPLLTPVFIGFAPATIQLTFASAAALSLASTALMRNATTRAMLQMTPFNHSASTATTGPYQGTLTLASSTSANASSSTSTSTPRTTPRSVLDAIRPSNITKGVNGFIANASELVSDAMPQVKQRVQTRQAKAAKSDADKYEAKRKQEIDEERFQFQQMVKKGRKRF